MWHTELPPARWYTPQTPGLLELLNELRDHKLVAIDSETTGLNEVTDRVLYFSLAWRRGGVEGQEQRVCSRADCLPYFKDLFLDASRRWVLANAKYDASLFANSGSYILGDLIDVAVMHALLFEEEAHGLKEMSAQILGWSWASFEQTFGKVNTRDPTDSYQKRLTSAEHTDLSKLVEYASNDAYGTLMLYYALRRMLERTATWSSIPGVETLWDYYEDTELSFTRVLWDCERAGIQIDQRFVSDIQNRVDNTINMARSDLNQAAGRLVNPTSHDDVRSLLYDELKIPPVRYTKGGKTGVRKVATDKETIDLLLEKPLTPKALVVVKALKAFAEVNALNTNFLPALRKVDNYGRLHTHLKQNGAATGRLSSSGPNLQNVKAPDRDPFGIRQAFVAPKGYCLIAADYSALEMMVLAAAAQEEEMLDIFRRGWDIHMGNAAMVYGFPYEDIVKAKKMDKAIKEGSASASAMTKYMKECLDARQAVKTIGYG